MNIICSDLNSNYATKYDEFTSRLTVLLLTCILCLFRILDGTSITVRENFLFVFLDLSLQNAGHNSLLIFSNPLFKNVFLPYVILSY
jgi:hypothetical protein